ncbi:MAG: preprotein translocase subunit SecE [Candidatus Nephrothrix sp. EaCA]|nr:MAG: preprotein translocase subunit SecE [Candidatus Nephrothrix sp. EaCA]
MKQIKNYLMDCVEEVRTRVSWPKFLELQSSAILVLVASFIFALIIGLVDFVFSNGLKWFYEQI